MNRFLQLSVSFARWTLPLILVTVLLTSAASAAPKPTATDNTLYYTSEDGRFDIMMPTPISLHEQTLTYSLDLHPYAQLNGPSLNCHQLAGKDYGAVWMVVYCDYPQEALSHLTPDQILDNARDSAFRDGLLVLEEENNISYDNHYPGRTFVYKLDARGVDTKGNDTYKAHAYIADNRLYWTAALVTADNLDNRLSKIDPFLDSFYIENPV